MSPIQTSLLGRQTGLLYRNLLPGQIASIINASLLAWIAWPTVASGTLLAWWLSLTGVATIRILTAFRYQRREPGLDEPEVNATWRRRALVGATISGLIWSTGAIMLMSAGSSTLTWFTAFLMAGMVAGAVPALAADRLIFRLFAWPIVLAVAFATPESESLRIAFITMCGLFLLMVTRSADYLNDTLHETFRLEHEKDGLIGELEQANRVAKQSNRMKSEFLANLSHELRTPMNAVIGFSDLLRQENLTDNQQQLLGMLGDSAGNLMHRIENLIQLSALEAGHLRIDAQLFGVHDLLEGKLPAHRRAAAAKGLTLSLHEDPAIPALLIGDSTRLGQVLAHLLENAIKFTDRGDIDVSLKLVDRDEGRVRIEFSVSDTGIGIPDHVIQQPHKLLVQGDGSSIRRHGGLGVGLPIVRKLLQLMGGELRIEQLADTGSRFSFILAFDLPDPSLFD